MLQSHLQSQKVMYPTIDYDAIILVYDTYKTVSPKSATRNNGD